MSSQPQLNIDRYVVIHVATTCDEHGVYVTKDSAEVIELGWILLDANSLEEVSRHFAPLQLIPPCPLPAWTHVCPFLTSSSSILQITHESVLVKPVNTPITPLCSKCPEAAQFFFIPLPARLALLGVPRSTLPSG